MIRLLTGDCREVLRTLPACSVHTVVTSPPYYGLRDYGTAQWDGGDAACDHIGPPLRRDMERERPTAGPMRGGSGVGGVAHYRDVCGKCGARRIDRQIGLEATPSDYLATMVEVFREVRRVLRDDGTCWVNIGDSYASTASNNGGYSAKSTLAGFTNPTTKGRVANDATVPHRIACGAKPKDLLLMPARLALELQADGWWVRSDIIWHKPNPMPESCTDRPTSAHEHVFLLSKRSRYYYDADVVREEGEGYGRGIGPGAYRSAKYVNGRSHDNSVEAPTTGAHGHSFEGGRNLRNVWTIATAPFADAHFATFPPALVERCIRAGTSERGCCAACGAPLVRVTERHSHCAHPMPERSLVTGATRNALGGQKEWDAYVAPTTTGWRASCQCAAGVVPATVLDPFVGSGTTALVADRLQRHAIGIDLNTDYARMAQERISRDCPMFVELPTAEDPEDARMRDLFAEAAE